MEKEGTNEHVLEISLIANSLTASSIEPTEFDDQQLRVQTSFAPFEDSKQSSNPTPSSTKPPKIPTTGAMRRRRSLPKSELSKPKSRLVEPPHPNDATLKDENNRLANSSSTYNSSPNVASPKTANNVSTPGDVQKSGAVTPKTLLNGSPAPEEDEDEDEDEDDEVYKTASLEVSQNEGKKWKVFLCFELITFLCTMVLLISSLTVNRLLHSMIWGVELWKWCVLVLVIFYGWLLIEWSMNILVFLIEKKYLRKNKVLYFVFGLKKSVQAVIWIGLTLLAWVFLFNRGVKRSRHTKKILHYVTRALASCLIGAAIWLVKNLLIKLLASKFHVKRFFERIQESVFHQYVVRVLSGPPLMEMAEQIGSSKTMPGQLSFKNKKKKKKDEVKKEEVIDVDKLNKMKLEMVSAWTMKGLVDAITGSGLSTLTNELDECEDEDGEQKDKEITSEWEAKAAAYKIFKNVAKPLCKFIEEEDLLRFMKKKEVDNFIPLIQEAAVTRKIKRSALKKWLVKIYKERKSLTYALNDAKTAIEELNRLVSVIVGIVTIIVWLLLMGFLTTKVLVFISSELLLVVFMFGNTAKTVFEAIIFVFVMHPFDVGDKCVVDGVQMVVEEVNILTTVFLRYDNEKIFYPNSVLATKPISNFYRSPEMGDTVEFAVHVSTSMETIGELKTMIRVYLESKPEHWRPAHAVQVKEIEDLNKMKMALYVTHTVNFQHPDRGNRRSDLVLEMKKIFEVLGIQYHLLPQEVHVRYDGSAVPPSTAR